MAPEMIRARKGPRIVVVSDERGRCSGLDNTEKKMRQTNAKWPLGSCQGSSLLFWSTE